MRLNVGIDGGKKHMAATMILAARKPETKRSRDVRAILLVSMKIKSSFPYTACRLNNDC